MSQDYKKILRKIEDINDSDDNHDIVTFVNSYPNLTKEDRKEILEVIGFKVDNDGKVKNTTILPITKFVK